MTEDTAPPPQSPPSRIRRLLRARTTIAMAAAAAGLTLGVGAALLFTDRGHRLDAAEVSYPTHSPLNSSGTEHGASCGQHGTSGPGHTTAPDHDHRGGDPHHGVPAPTPAPAPG
ncbi:hypothetical protein [Mycolicibacterium fortuitum]|uniref:hypothetical protein n=1 Tax=Mycolicibacterium fortuitum TaxID=1766 RepID=UPI00149019C3|nr:hypothetical protein [Mycolicibacterium fortuitum]